MCKAIKDFFGIKSPAVEETKTVKEAVKELLGKEVKEEHKKAEEWIWVDGYKGMDRDMQCLNNFQYEIGKTYDMPEGSTIELCDNGFHFCMKLSDVFRYFNVGCGNRFFQVRALVRKGDADKYGEYEWGEGSFMPRIDKLAAKSIEIVRELTVDEILEPFGCHEWDDGYKKMALSVSIDAARYTMKIDKLTDLGYSLSFSQWLVNNKKYEIAKAVGSQTDLSMDMKCLMILQA